jgi:DNA primase
MSNGKDWIDFNLVKQSISMEMLIIHFGLFSIERKEDEVRLRCPFHNGKSDNSMAINLTRNMFYCFGCRVKGNVLDFVSKYEDCSLREAAQLLDEWFFINSPAAVESREVGTDSRKVEKNVPSITPQHLIASIEYQLAQLKKLILSAR